MRRVIVGFTGPNDLPEDVARAAVEPVLQRLLAKWPDITVRTGAAYGIDTAAYVCTWRLRPDVPQQVVVPDARHNAQVVRFALEHGHVVVYAPAGASTSESYMNRNDVLVEPLDELHAFPRTSTRVVRSGTWATVRRAERLGIPVFEHPLS